MRKDLKEMKIIFFSLNDEDECVELELPGKFQVCDRCEGKGKHVNPNIDGHGITSSEWEQDWDEESRDAYMSGAYDVQCYECEGRNVTLEVDEANSNKEILEEFHKYIEERHRHEAECAAERRMGC